MSQQLTPEQEKLVTDNMRLVYYHFHKLKNNELKFRYEDDLVSEGYIGLIKAAKNFDPERCKFATYATRCINNEFFMFLRKVRRHYTVSLDTPIGTCDDDGTEITLGDVVLADNSMHEKLDADELMEIRRCELGKFMQNRKQRDQDVIKLKCQGKKQRKIGEELGISQSYVSRVYRKVRENFEIRQRKLMAAGQI